jgi:hypothetical protein
LAIAIYSNETFEPDDERLNYESYKELSLICGECKEAIFLKKGEVSSPTFPISEISVKIITGEKGAIAVHKILIHRRENKA